jgi:hypothetical protein
VRKVLDAMATVSGFAAAALVLAVFLVPGTFYREACVDRFDGTVTHERWHFSPVAWFSPGELTATKTCESETATEWAAGQIPVVGAPLERAMGGPSDPAYYR